MAPKYADKDLIKHIRCETPEDKQKLDAALDGLMKQQGLDKVGQIVPGLINLIKAEGIDVPESITSHVQNVVASLDVVRAEVQAIAASYGTVENREAAKAQTTINNLLADLDEERAKVKKADEKLEATKLDLRNVALNEDYFERQLHATEEKLAAVTAERDKLFVAVTDLTANLGADENQRKAVLAALAPAPAEEQAEESDVQGGDSDDKTD